MSVNEIVNIENVIINLIKDYRKVNHFVFIEIKQQHIQYIIEKNQCSLKLMQVRLLFIFRVII